MLKRTVVVEASVWGDKKAEIEIPEKIDVKQWIHESLTPIMQQIDSLNNQLVESNKKYDKLSEFINTINEISEEDHKNINALIEKLKEKISFIESDKALWDKRFETLSHNLSKDFINQCRHDVEFYFTKLANEYKVLQEKSKDILRKQENISEHLSLITNISNFFIEIYKTELDNNENKLRSITKLATILEKIPNNEQQK